ncbi:hypothetical protein Tco_0182133 [Tanacetum coccineum]
MLSIRINKLSFEEDEEASGEDKDEEEEHLAPADSVALPIIDPIPLAEETKPFEKDKSALAIINPIRMLVCLSSAMITYLEETYHS